MQVVVGALLYVMNMHVGLRQKMHQLACMGYNSGSLTVQALDHVLSYLAGIWTAADLQNIARFQF